MSAPMLSQQAPTRDLSVNFEGQEPAMGQESLHSIIDSAKDLEKSSDSPQLGPAPEGGVRAWLVAAAGATIFFCTLGFANSFGAFVEYYASHQLKDETQSRISWIGSLAAFLQFFAGMVAGPMFDRYGEKVIRPAAVLYVFAVMMLSLCKNYWEIMLVQGVLMGIVMGFLQFPTFAVITHYFDKNRAAALGLAVSGSSIGGIIIPIALSKMLNGTSLGFEWSVRIIGFILLPLCAFACVAIKARLPPRKTQFWLIAPAKDRRFVLLVIGMFFMFFGMFTPFFYLPIFAVSRGMSPTMSGYLLSILNAASTFGRIVPGILADRYGRMNMLGLGGILTGVVIFCMSSATSNAGLIVYAVFFGFSSGTIISGASAALSLCPKNTQDVGTYMGMGMAVAGLGALVGPPVNGAIQKTYGGYFEVCMLSGALCTFGGFIAFAAKRFTPQGVFGNT